MSNVHLCNHEDNVGLPIHADAEIIRNVHSKFILLIKKLINQTFVRLLSILLMFIHGRIHPDKIKVRFCKTYQDMKGPRCKADASHHQF